MSDTTSPVLGSGFFTLSFGQFKCKAALDSNDGNEMVANLRLVPTGTKCGEEMVSAWGMSPLEQWEVTPGHGAVLRASHPPPGLLRRALPEPSGLWQEELLSKV